MNNYKQRQNAWAEAFADIIKMKDLYGRSFTKGVALYHLASESRLDDDLEDQLDFELHAFFGEPFYAELERLGCSTDVRDIIHLPDLSTLDAIARNLEGDE